MAASASSSHCYRRPLRERYKWLLALGVYDVAPRAEISLPTVHYSGAVTRGKHTQPPRTNPRTGGQKKTRKFTGSSSEFSTNGNSNWRDGETFGNKYGFAVSERTRTRELEKKSFVQTQRALNLQPYVCRMAKKNSKRK